MPEGPRVWSRASASRSARWARPCSPSRGSRRSSPRRPRARSRCSTRGRRRRRATRARGVIALKEENCTSCMLCGRSCPDWCIYIEAHKELAPPRREGGKPRQVNKLDRFDIDYSLCMYCGICVEVCPFDALFWSPEYEYSEPRIADLLHDKDRLGEWMETVPDFEAYEAGSRGQGQRRSRGDPSARSRSRSSPRTSSSALIAVAADRRRASASSPRRTSCTPPSGSCSCWPASAPTSCCVGRRVRRRHPDPRLHRRHRRAVPVRHDAHPGADRRGPDGQQPVLVPRPRRRPAAARAPQLRAASTPSSDTELPRGDRADDRARSATRSSATYLIPFEAIGLLLTAALIGAIVLARKE